MTWRQLKKVHNGYIELYAKWAGSEKIPGCCKRHFPTVIITDKTTENNRAANEYLNVSFNKNNNWIDLDFHQEWDYWKFDFSPCKIDREQKLSQEEIFKDYWQGRWKYLVEIAKQPKPEGKDHRNVEKNLNNYRQTYFHYRTIMCKEFKRSNDCKKLSVIIAQGNIEKHLITTRIISKLFLWIRRYRMDKEKSRKLNDLDEQYKHEEGAEREIVNQELEADLDKNSIDLLQNDKYWITIGALSDKLIQYKTKYIMDNLNLYFAEMMDIKSTIKDLASKQKEQEQELQRVQRESIAEAIQSNTQLQHLLRELGDVASDIDLLTVQIEDNEDSVQDLASQTGELMQLSNLRNDAIKMAAGMSPPVILESSSLRNDL